MTITRWASSATTPRSWVISMMAVPVRSRRSRSRSRICAWMVTSSAVVGSSAIRMPGIAGERHGDHDALAHAAGKLVRIFVEPRLRRGDLDQLQHLERAGARLGGGHRAMQADRLDDLVARRLDRIEAGHRFLEDHRDGVAAHGAHLGFGQVEQVPAFEEDLAARDPAGRTRHQPHDGERGHRLAAARFAHDAQRLAWRERERDTVHGREHTAARTELGTQVADLEEGRRIPHHTSSSSSPPLGGEVR